MFQSMTRSRTRGCIILAVIALLFLFVLAVSLSSNMQNLSSRPQPAGSYAEAVQRINTIEAQETSDLTPACRLQFMTHGQKVARAIIFVHGYTFCPQMFQALGTQFFDLGYNVLIPRLPHHGLADRLTPEQAQLTAEELAAYADQWIDIARGLGDHVTMAGISGGGVVTAWAAQNRADLDLAAPISPGFGFKLIPAPLTQVVMNIALRLPNSFQWWDADQKEKGALPGGYPRYSTHALAQILRLGFATRALAQQRAPVARSILVITNANDTDVDNAVTAGVVQVWQDHGANLRTFQFDASLKLGHDLIDPARPDQRTDIVYPQLIDLLAHPQK